MDKRLDDFNMRRTHLLQLNDEELKNRFWELAEQIVNPMLELGRKHTSPSIERSVLLRMGFSSIEANEIVKRTIENGLMGKGCGHIVYKLSMSQGISIREAGIRLAKGEEWDIVEQLFLSKEEE